MRALKLVVPASVLTAGFLICTTASYGTPGLLEKGKEGLHLLPLQDGDRHQRRARTKPWSRT